MASLAGRRLAELLQEQQEPFLLDVCLMRNGCSPGRFLCSDATATCWPGGTGYRGLQRLAGSSGFRGRGERIMGSLLGVFSRRRPSSQSHRWVGGLPSSVRMAKACADKRSKDRSGEVGKTKLPERSHVREGTEEAKQLSPISVLELQSDDGSPAHEYAIEGPSTSGLYGQLGAAVGLLEGLHGSASSHYGVGVQGRRQVPQRSLGSHRRRKARRRHLRWRVAAEPIAASDLESDVSDDYMRQNLSFNPHVMEVEAEVGDALLEELVEDLCLTYILH